jgi:hypothetical protein
MALAAICGPAARSDSSSSRGRRQRIRSQAQRAAAGAQRCRQFSLTFLAVMGPPASSEPAASVRNDSEPNMS